MRTVVDLPADQISGLAAYCRREHISRAEAIRRSIARLLADRDPPDQLPEGTDEERDAVLKRAFGAWKHRGIDSLEYQRRLRAEWDREWDSECGPSSTPTSSSTT